MSKAAIKRVVPSPIWRTAHTLRARLRQERSRLRQERRERLLRRVRGVIHIGANIGQERDDYAAHGLCVAWIEPIPSIFEKLAHNITGYERQVAYRYLLADQDCADCVLHVANVNGGSSSILDLAEHREVWPEVDHVDDLHMPSITLDSFVRRERLNLADYNYLRIATQGAELMILQGGTNTLKAIDVITAQVADFEAFRNCARPKTIAAFLSQHGFREFERWPFASHPRAGRYFDITYLR